jgi:hypothetical protein
VPLEQLVARVLRPGRDVGDRAAVGGEELQHLPGLEGLHLLGRLHDRHRAEEATGVEDLVYLYLHLAS